MLQAHEPLAVAEAVGMGSMGEAALRLRALEEVEKVRLAGAMRRVTMVVADIVERIGLLGGISKLFEQCLSCKVVVIVIVN